MASSLSRCAVPLVLVLVSCGSSAQKNTPFTELQRPSPALKNAQQYIAKHEYVMARTFVATELKQHPDNVEAYLLLGMIGLLQNDQPMAGSAFDKALLLQPSAKPRIATAYLDAVATLLSTGRSASAYIDEAIAIDPTLKSSLATWAIATVKAHPSERNDAPLIVLLAAARLAPNDRARIGTFCLTLAHQYLDQGLLPEAGLYALRAGNPDTGIHVRPDHTMENPEHFAEAAAILRTVGLQLPRTEKDTIGEYLGTAVRWNPSLRNDEEVMWVGAVLTADDHATPAAEFLQHFPNSKHKAEAEQFISTKR